MAEGPALGNTVLGQERGQRSCKQSTQLIKTSPGEKMDRNTREKYEKREILR